MEEKTIVLDKIDFEKENTAEAIGVTPEEIKNCVRKIRAEHSTTKSLLEMLGLNKDEVSQVVNELTAANRFVISKAIVKIWKNKGRAQITLIEYVGTSILIWTLINRIEEQGLFKAIRLPKNKASYIA